jgi:methylmalonyl-CoA mutase
MKRTKKLFDEFPPVSTEEWVNKLNSDLKGTDFRKKLMWLTPEGIGLLPFYREEDLPGSFYSKAYIGKEIHNNWRVRQDVIVENATDANRKALDLLMKGIDELGFIINDPQLVNSDEIGKLLKDIDPVAASVSFVPQGKALELAEILTEWAENGNFSLPDMHGAIEADPLGRLMVNGTLCIAPEQGFDYLAGVIRSLGSLPACRAIKISASHFRNAGSDTVTELAFALSMGAEYLAVLSDRGLDSNDIASKIRFSFGTGSHYFTEIAKLRAARILWSLILDRFNSDDQATGRMEIHSVTSRWNKTLFDPYVNMLRTQTEAMSAILGGTDSLTIEAFDMVLREPSLFSERIARNQQLILKEEARFDQVADPGAGSYYIEKLTLELTEKAWALFVETEKQGGFLEALKKGFVQSVVKKSAEQRLNEISKRKEIFVGTNLYPDLTEDLKDVNRKMKGDANPPSDDRLVEPLSFVRGASVFEEIRRSALKAEKRPLVFLLECGNPVWSKARAGFSSDFFGCAGYHIESSGGTLNPAEGAQKAVAKGADIAVICSSDDEYAVMAPEVYKELKGKMLVVVAGNPPCMDQLKSSGIEHFISIRSDAVASLKKFNSLLGIKDQY